MPKRDQRTMHLPEVMRNGRRYTEYNPTIALEIVERIADGELLTRITAKDAQPLTVTKATFLQWVATVPELAKAYAAALQMSAHAFEEKALDTAETIYTKGGGKDKIAAANTYISQLRWSATRRNPTKYSDKGNTAVVVPVTINTTLDMGKGADSVEDQSVYNLSLSKKEEAEDGDFIDVSNTAGDERNDPVPELQDESAKHAFFVDTLKADTPSEGTERQPLLEKAKGKRGAPKGPRKRVLTPRIAKEN